MNMNMNMNMNAAMNAMANHHSTGAANSASSAAAPSSVGVMNDALSSAHFSNSGASVTSLPTIAQYSNSNSNSTTDFYTTAAGHSNAATARAAALNMNMNTARISRGLGVNTIRQAEQFNLSNVNRQVTTPRGNTQMLTALPLGNYTHRYDGVHTHMNVIPQTCA